MRPLFFMSVGHSVTYITFVFTEFILNAYVKLCYSFVALLPTRGNFVDHDFHLV